LLQDAPLVCCCVEFFIIIIAFAAMRQRSEKNGRENKKILAGI
jgi:hypothetical protein